MGTEWCVAYQRAGLRPKRRKFRSSSAAERFLLRLGPEPWKARGLDPDALACCSGQHCGCGGATVRESDEEYSSGMPPLVRVGIERREVSDWTVVREVLLSEGLVMEVGRADD